MASGRTDGPSACGGTRPTSAVSTITAMRSAPTNTASIAAAEPSRHGAGECASAAGVAGSTRAGEIPDFRASAWIGSFSFGSWSSHSASTAAASNPYASANARTAARA